MIVEKVSRGREIDREMEQKQKADQLGEILLEVENQSKIEESKWLKD